MSKAFTTRAAFLASVTFASLAAAAAQTAPPSRVTIKGRGGEVSIERTDKPVRRRAFGEGAVSGGVVGEAIRMKARGADDTVVVTYLRAHRTELPSVIEAAEARQLHRAGAGEAVMAYLATESAIDIGETGEGSGAQVVSVQPPAESGIGYGTVYGYPAVSGYGVFRGMRPPVRIAHRPIHRPVFPMPFRANRPFPQ